MENSLKPSSSPPSSAGPRGLLSRQMIVFAVIGVVNTGTYYGPYLVFLTRFPYLVAHILATAISMTGSFFLNAHFTYRTRPTWRKFLLFPLTNAANFVVTTAGVYILVDLLHLDSRYAPLLASLAAIPVTFVVSRRIMLPKAETDGIA